MTAMLSGYAETLYGLMRVVVGLLFACHGAQKLLGQFGGVDGQGASVPLVGLMGLGGSIEIVCGLLIAVGFFTSYAAFLASGMMAVAYWMAHGTQGFWPITNKGELAVVYCFLFLYLASRGGGRFSIDGSR